VRTLTIDQLETFLAIVKHKGFRHASCKLFLSQPTVSSRIQALERELNVPLFIRSGRKVTLSEQGERLLPFATGIVGLYHGAQLEMARRQHGIHQTID
jgi:DNA-binding transcriptional LysR family regulator